MAQQQSSVAFLDLLVTEIHNMRIVDVSEADGMIRNHVALMKEVVERCKHCSTRVVGRFTVLKKTGESVCACGQVAYPRRA
jgi:hypothetical protein